MASNPERETRSALCVLASGSRGNCSALVIVRSSGRRDVILFDLGLSPRRTRRTLDAIGVSIDDVRAAVVTHLDSDHCNPGWARGRGDSFPLYVHERHLGRAERGGFINARADRFNDDPFEITGEVRISAMMMTHDDLGVAAFRVSHPGGASLGYATDVGHATQGLAEHLAMFFGGQAPVFADEAGFDQVEREHPLSQPLGIDAHLEIANLAV